MIKFVTKVPNDHMKILSRKSHENFRYGLLIKEIVLKLSCII